ncbi:CotH kinase family protein [Dietzia sp. PP-33]|uniref:CotH kinase family protein n=1 Tax=Dietzia sp. PP-33 TaxID=2957500 RepID=UPI0039B10C31
MVLGGIRVRPYITGDADVIASTVTQNVTGTVELFDDTVAHQIHLEITDVEYADMIEAYERDGDKDWVTADMTIDGVFVNDVAVRLKGNSTLRGLRGDSEAAGGEGGGGRQARPGMGQTGERPAMPDGAEPPVAAEGGQPPAMPDGAEPPAMAEGAEPPVAQEGAEAPGGMFGMNSGISVDDPATLPLLISFDQNYPGRAYQGMTELSVRPGTPVLNEAMALELTEATGQATQRYAYSEYSVNDGATTSRLLLEHPDDGYASTDFEGSGYLYKADASSNFAYVGEDQSDYSDQFKQVNAQGNGTMQPIIDLLRWVDSADDEEFAAELDQWVDVDSLAAYIATQNLLGNSDDMSGPGQNYYLWYDLESEKFTVVSWDLNLAMSGNTAAGPDDTVSMGGRAGAGGMPGAAAPAAGAAVPEGGQDVAGQVAAGQEFAGQNAADQWAARQEAAGQLGMAEGADGEQRPGGMGGSHPLKTRFLDSDAFTALYEQKYWELYDQMYGSGLAAQTLDDVEAAFPVSDEVDQATLEQEATSLRAWIEQRTTALAEQRPA